MLQEESIIGMAERYGFTSAPHVEKFIMCFEAHRRIAQEMECAVRGGLCMPFHQPDFEVRRMSIDVDIVSPCTVAEVDRAIGRIGGDGLTCRKHSPSDPYPIDNLVSYRVTFSSCLGGDSSIKIDAFCGADLGLAFRQIPAGSRILDFGILQNMTILSRGALLADKSTTLALETIGLKPPKETEIAKQLYDIAVLLRPAGRDDLETAYDSYTKMTGFKAASYRRDPPYTIPEIASDAAGSIRGLLSFDNAVTVTGAQHKRYTDFCGSYLSTRRAYRKTEHVADVLLAYLLSLSLRRYSTPATSGHGGSDDGLGKMGEVDSMHQVLEEVSALGQRSRESGRRPTDEDRQVRAESVQAIPDSFVNKKILRGAQLEHVLLVRALSAISPPLTP